MQKSRKLPFIVVTVSAFVLMAVMAFGLPQQDQGGERGQRRRGQSPDQMLEHMSKALNLTDDQKTQIKPILEDQSKQMQAVFADDSLSREQKMEKMGELREASHKKINAILTEEQREKFAEMQSKGPGSRKDKDGGEHGKKNKDNQ